MQMRKFFTLAIFAISFDVLAIERIEFLYFDGTKLNTSRQISQYDLKQLVNLEKKLSIGLSPNETQALQESASRVSRAVSKETLEVWKGHLIVHRYKVERLPAILIDRKFVYYGRDLEKAITLFKQKKGVK